MKPKETNHPTHTDNSVIVNGSRKKSINKKLIIISKGDIEKALDLLAERRTVECAMANCGRINQKDVTNPYAESRTVNPKALLIDFQSKDGTFFQRERMEKESAVRDEEKFQIDSSKKFFFPHDEIDVKETIKPKNQTDGLTILTPRVKKLLVFIGLSLSLMSALKIASYKVTNTTQTRNAATTDRPKEKNFFAVPELPSNEDNSRSPDVIESQTSTATADETILQVQKNTADIYFSVATKFLERRLWGDALDYYEKVSKLNPDYPGLSGQIVKAKYEIENKAAYKQGASSINEGRYDAGISNLQMIDENSVYYDNSDKLIAEAKQKIKTKKNTDRKITINGDAKRRIDTALAFYREGEIEKSHKELEYLLKKSKNTDTMIKASARSIDKRISLSTSYYNDGERKYAAGQLDAAFAEWEKFFDVDNTLVSNGKSRFAQSAGQKMAAEYSSRADAAYAEGDLVNASRYSSLALKASEDDKDALKMHTTLDEKIQAIYEEGYILESYNREKANEKWRQVLKISRPQSDYYKKAIEKLSQK